MNLYFGIKHAKEEILQLNIEIHCLVMFMIDDHHDFYHAIGANIIVEPALAHELSCQWEYCHQIHSKITSWLHQTSQLKGFTGTLLPGTQEGNKLMDMARGGLPGWATDIFGLVESFDKVEEVDRMEVKEEELEHDEVVPKEVVVDSDLILQLLKNISVQDTLDNHSN